MTRKRSSGLPVRVVRLRAGVSLVKRKNTTTLEARTQSLSVSPDEISLAQALARGGMDSRDVNPETLSRLDAEGWITSTFYMRETALFQVTFSERPAPHAEYRSRQLSVNATLERRSDDSWVVSALLARGTVRLWAPSLVTALVSTASRSGARVEPAEDRLWEALARAGLLAGVAHDAPSHWSPEELAFHRLSRGFDSTRVLGATYWGTTKKRQPQRAASPLSRSVRLPRNDPARLPILDSIAARRSVRTFSREPVSLSMLSSLLWHAARNLAQMDVGGSDRELRPYPSAGGLHELDLHVVSDRIGGLPAGVYRYDGIRHELAFEAPWGARAHQVLERAQSAMGADQAPPAVVLITAKFERVMRVYEGIGYSLILKNVGALMQTMYLVANAIGLDGCALGAGVPGAAGSLLPDLDAQSEDVVGEFAFGVGSPA